jgi:hypothetical protein
MQHVAALDAGNITKIGVGIIIALVVIGILLSLIITAIIGRIVIAVIVVLLGVFVWQQRSSIEHKIHTKNCNLTFFGMHLDPPDSLKKHCG